MRFLAHRLAALLAVLLAVTALAFGALNILGDPLFNVVGFVASVDCDAVLAGEIEDISGQTVIILVWPLAWSYRIRAPPPPGALPTAPE